MKLRGLSNLLGAVLGGKNEAPSSDAAAPSSAVVTARSLEVRLRILFTIICILYPETRYDVIAWGRLPRDITSILRSIRLGFVCRDKMMMCWYWLVLVMMQNMPSRIAQSMVHCVHCVVTWSMHIHIIILYLTSLQCVSIHYSSYHQALPPVTKIGNNGSWGDFLLELCQGTFRSCHTKCIL